MHKLKFRLIAKSDLLFARLSGERNTVSTYDYVPGTTILGILAGKFIGKNNLGISANSNDKFREIFLDGNVKFSNCYITDQHNDTFPLPKALNHHKRKTDKYCNFLSDEYKNCSEEDISDYKSASGYGLIKDHNIYVNNVQTGLNFHHKRNKDTGSSEKGMIFNYEYIKPGTVFHGEINGNKEDLELLKGLVTENEVLRAGRSKSAQYGEVILNWNGEISEYNVESKGKGSYAITLISDLIIYNDCGMPATNYDDLSNYLKKISESDKFTIRNMFLYQDTFENFIAHWKLKKPMETCFAKGSCFVIEGIDKSKLNEWEAKGIGERTGEGFGRIKVNYPDSNIEEFNNGTDKNKTVQKPSDHIPEKLMNIINSILKKEQLKAAAKLGSTDGNLFSGWSTSFPGKLWSMYQEAHCDKGKFFRELDNLPDRAKSKLTDIYIGNSNIREHLISFKINNIGFDFKKVSEIISISEDHIAKANEEELFKEYLKSFLTTARRKAKSENQKTTKTAKRDESEVILNG